MSGIRERLSRLVSCLCADASRAPELGATPTRGFSPTQRLFFFFNFGILAPNAFGNGQNKLMKNI